MKKALVLAGGGTKGVYQAGVIRALIDLGKNDWNMVFGTSVGALNALMLVQKDYAGFFDIYTHLKADDIIGSYIPFDISLNKIVSERESLLNTAVSYFKDRGVDISPFEKQVEEKFDPEKFFASDIDFGCIAATHPKHEPVYVTKEMMRERGKDWLIASASAFPAFPVKVIDGQEYVDGGYFDNLPVDFALRQGAEEVIAIDLRHEATHPGYRDRPRIDYISPTQDLPRFLEFDRSLLEHSFRIGYLDACKFYGVYEGYVYTFEKAELPAFFHKWYLQMLMLETRIKLASNIGERFRSRQHIRNRLLEYMDKTHLEYRDYFYGMMDHLMRICGMDDTWLYTYEEARNRILAEFAGAVDKNYDNMPAMQGIRDLAEYAKTLNTKGIIEKMIHANFFPEHRILTENMALTVYPFEQALADFVTCMMKELPEESADGKSSEI